jgi:hypothetical protein
MGRTSRCSTEARLDPCFLGILAMADKFRSKKVLQQWFLMAQHPATPWPVRCVAKGVLAIFRLAPSEPVQYVETTSPRRILAWLITLQNRCMKTAASVRFV